MGSKRNTLRKSTRTEKRFNAGMSWTDADLQRLVELYPKNSNRDLSTTFGRAELGIIGKARSLGLQKNRSNGYRRWVSVNADLWSIEEITLLEELFSTTPAEEIAEIIDRSANAIAIKARKLGLRKMEFWTDQENEFLRSHYQQLTYEQLAHQLGRTLSATKARITTLGLECKVENWTEHDVDFLKESYPQKNFCEIAAELGRTYHAVARKTAKMGLIRNYFWSEEECAILKHLYRKHTSREIAETIGKKWESVRYHIEKLGLSKPRDPSKVKPAPALSNRPYSRQLACDSNQVSRPDQVELDNNIAVAI